MNTRLFTVAVIVFALLAASACNPSGDGTARAVGAGKGDQGKLCYQTQAYWPGPKTDLGSPPEDFKGTVVGTARSFQDFYRGLLSLQPKLDKVYDIDANTPIDRTPAETAVSKYLRDELFGKHISGWQGWIVQTGVQAVWDAPYEVPPSDNYSKALLISTTDPFTTTIASPVKGQKGFFDIPQLNSPYLIVANATEANGQQLCVGQKVIVEGDVTWLPTFSYIDS